MSGHFIEVGLGVKRGLDLAIEEINGAGGIRALGGAKIKLLTGDHQGNSEIGILETERLIHNGVITLTGGGPSDVVYATTEVAEKYKVPHIIETGIADSLTERGFQYTFRITPTTSIAVKNGLAYIGALEKETGVKLKTAVHLHEPTMFGMIVSQILKKYAPGAGIEVIEAIKYNLPATNLTCEIMKVGSLNPDILVTTSWLADGMLIVRTLKQLKVAPKMVTGIYNAAFSNPNFLPEMGEDTEFIMDIDQYPNMKDPAAQVVSRKIREKFAKELDFRAAYGYTAVYFFKDALERARSADTEAVKETMKTSTMLAPLVHEGRIKFDKNGQNINATVPMTQVQRGKVVIVKPESWAEAKARLPFPKWEGR